ncbi:hypothetical protein ACM39_16715 [Chryseobacterium sp. FH2]|nr:hypothetical protein ACM39_16715 [Chryseobacterium sp. FH2]
MDHHLSKTAKEKPSKRVWILEKTKVDNDWSRTFFSYNNLENKYCFLRSFSFDSAFSFTFSALE